MRPLSVVLVIGAEAEEGCARRGASVNTRGMIPKTPQGEGEGDGCCRLIERRGSVAGGRSLQASNSGDEQNSRQPRRPRSESAAKLKKKTSKRGERSEESQARKGYLLRKGTHQIIGRQKGARNKKKRRHGRIELGERREPAPSAVG